MLNVFEGTFSQFEVKFDFCNKGWQWTDNFAKKKTYNWTDNFANFDEQIILMMKKKRWKKKDEQIKFSFMHSRKIFRS